ncbi:MAG: Ig-like domain-containing protein [Vicinamibacterales bacterium]
MLHLRRWSATVALAAVLAAPAAARAQQTLGSPNVTLLSHGLTAEPDTNAVSPDASGDMGPTQYLLAVNGRIRSFAKATGAPDGSLNATTDLFFTTVRNGAATSAPRVRFDRRAGRWLVLMTTAALPNRYLLAISNSATAATGAWTFMQWTNDRTQGGVGGGAACVGDDPTLALDEDAVYVGVNQRCGAALNALAFDSTSLYVLRRSSVLAGSVADRTPFHGLVATPTSPGIYAPQGVTNFDDDTSQGYVIGVDNLDKGRLVLRRITNPGGTPTLSADIVVTQDVDPTGDAIDVPHPGGVLPLAGHDHRLGQAVIRNGRLWTSHHFEVDTFGEADVNGNRNGVRWYELTNLIGVVSQVQSGTIWDPAGANPASFWTSAIMPTAQGHVALGMSTAGPLSRVHGAVTGRLAGAAIGTMSAPAIFTPAHTFTFNLQGAPATSQPWSRVSSTSLDPDDDMTVWTLQQFVDGFDSWGLQLVRVVAPPPATISSVSPNALAAGLAGAAVTVTGSATGGRGFFDPGAGFLRRLTAAFSGAGVTVTNVAYTSPTSLTLTVNTVGAAAGPRTLTVTNPDGQTSQLAAALTITTAPVNQPPVAVNDAVSIPFNSTLNAPAPGVLANDSDPEGQGLTAQLVSNVSHGSLSLGSSGSVVYVPAAGFSGIDSFTYRASDGVNQSNVATVTISVGANRAPVFTLVPASRTLYDPGSGVSSGPLALAVSDPDGHPLAVTASSSNTAVVPATGVVLASAGGARSVTISTAGATTLGASTITLTASDGSLTAAATFTITRMASTVPGAPQNFTATTVRNTVFFTWQAPASATGEPVQTYLLEAGAAPGAPTIGIPLGNVLAFSATVPDALYYVRLRAVTPAGPGPVSNEVQIALGQAAPPLPPLSLLAMVQGTAVTLRWTENPLGPVIGGYQVQAGTATGLVDIGVIPLSAATRTLAVNAPPATYFVRLVAVNAAGASAPSNEAVVTTGAGICTIPAVPTGLQATASAGRISVTWNAAAAGAIPLGYVLQAGSISGGSDRATLTLPATTTAVGGAVPPGPYFIRLAAGNACGVSAPSAEVSVVVP